MARNEGRVREKYRGGEEEGRATRSRYAGLEFYYTKRHLDGYVGRDASVVELGCGTGYYALHFADRCREYLGVDLVPEHVAALRGKAAKRGLANVRAQLGDATCLRELPDGAFDVVLCLGPLYHLPPDERELVFSECRRICRRGGVAAFAYISRVGVYAGGCVHDQLRERYPNERANAFLLEQSRDDVNPDLFFYTMPEEIEAVARRYGFEKVKNLGTDFFVTMSAVEAMDDEKFELMRPLLDSMADSESCTGMSNHALLVCKRV